jgi:hypothetical protein
LQIGPELYTNLPDKNSTLAIGPLAGEAARLWPIPGEPAALPAGQVARLGQGAHLGATVTGVGAEGRPARGRAGDQARWPRRLGETGEGGVALDNKRTGKVHWG